MTFDRKSQFDRSFFDRMMGGGIALPARIAGRFTISTRTGAFTKVFRAADPFTVTERTSAFTVVAYK